MKDGPYKGVITRSIMSDSKRFIFTEGGEWNDDSARRNNWQVISPACNYLGLSYGQWAARWLNWLLSVDPDLNNNGPIVFLRGVDFERRMGSYMNFIRIGKERIRVSLDQAVFFPIICLFVDEHMVPSLDDEQKRLSDVFDGALNADHPPQPNQTTLNGDPIVSNLTDFFTVSPDFILHVPEASYEPSSKRTLGQLFKIPITYAGDWKAAIGGVFALMKPLQAGNYFIASNGNAEDRYHTEMLVQIEVFDNSPKNRWKAQGELIKEIAFDEGLKQKLKVQENETMQIDKDSQFIDKIIDNSHKPSSS